MRTCCLFAFLTALAMPAWAEQRASVVFEGGGERMEVAAGDLAGLALRDKGQGMGEVQFALSENDAARFAEMTEKLVGEKMSVAVCDRVLAEPVVMLPIEGGQVAVTGGLEFMTDLYKALDTGSTCPKPPS